TRPAFPCADGSLPRRRPVSSRTMLSAGSTGVLPQRGARKAKRPSKESPVVLRKHRIEPSQARPYVWQGKHRRQKRATTMFQAPPTDRTTEPTPRITRPDSRVTAVQRACRYIEARVDGTDCADGRDETAVVTLAELGEHCGLSPWHLQRLFKRTMGVSPRQYADAHRMKRFKAGLQHGGG